MEKTKIKKERLWGRALGALHSVLTGGNVMMSGIICDMLEDYVMNKNCN